VAINLTLWRFLYQGDTAKVLYMTKYTITSHIIAMFYMRGITERIASKVLSGAFVTDLIKPINFFFMSWQMEFASTASMFVLRGLPLIAIYCPFMISDRVYFNIPWAVFAVVLGHVLFSLIYSLLGFSAFILITVWPFTRLLDDTIRLFSGAFIPLSVLPGWLHTAANLLPFRFLYAFPLKLLFENVGVSFIVSEFFVLFGWIGLFAVLNLLMYRFALRNVTVLGG
jgi:ABC-2 type transport system permease protein